MFAMTAEAPISREETSKVERDAQERRLLRAIVTRQRMRDMASQIPTMRHGAELGNPERVEWHLLNWKAWAESGSGFIPYVIVAVGLSDGGASQHFDDMTDTVERRVAVAMNEIIHGLPDAQRTAILVDAGHAPDVFRYRTSKEEKLAEAKLSIGAALKARGIW